MDAFCCIIILPEARKLLLRHICKLFQRNKKYEEIDGLGSFSFNLISVSHISGSLASGSGFIKCLATNFDAEHEK